MNKIESENQVILLKAYVFAEQAQPPRPRRDLATLLRIVLEPSQYFSESRGPKSTR